jgi:hypothetical protein
MAAEAEKGSAHKYHPAKFQTEVIFDASCDRS